MALVARHLTHEVTDLLKVFPAVEILGARQVGKSTLTSLVTANDRQPLTRFTLDDPETRQAAADDPRGFMNQTSSGTLVIDEFQRVPELSLALKATIDTDRTPGRFLLTESTTQARRGGTADSLAGRVVGVQLFGFSQGELAGRVDDFVAALLAEKQAGYESALTRADYIDILARGTMPEVVGLPARARTTWLTSYLERLLSRDVLSIAQLSDPLRLRSLLAALAATQGSETVINRLGNLANLAASTTTDYIELLRALFLVERLPPWTPNLLKREVGRSKYFLPDTAVAMLLSRTTPAVLENVVSGASALGGLLEAFVAAELSRQRGWSAVRFDLSHYRSPDGREIDLICELDDGRVIAIEAKAAQSTSASDVRHLAWLREKLGDQLVAGVVLTMDTRSRSLGDRLWALPVSSLWEL